MPDVTGLPAFVDAVASYLQSNGVSAVVELGWRKDVQQVNEGDGTANRIVIQPGTPDGDAGGLEAPRQVGYGLRTEWPPPTDAEPQSPDDVVGRELDDWAERATVYVWAVDATAPEDDRRQYVAVRCLLQWFRRAAQYAARAALDVGALHWVNIANVERQYGRELQLDLTLHAPLFDLSDEIAHPQHLTPTTSFDEE
jgi:hypothetical protein